VSSAVYIVDNDNDDEVCDTMKLLRSTYSVSACMAAAHESQASDTRSSFRYRKSVSAIQYIQYRFVAPVGLTHATDFWTGSCASVTMAFNACLTIPLALYSLCLKFGCLLTTVCIHKLYNPQSREARLWLVASVWVMLHTRVKVHSPTPPRPSQSGTSHWVS